MSLKKEIQSLQEEGVISEETASRILAYYKQRESGKSNRILIVFGVLGAILVGLGIILILAHNWDQFSRQVRTMLAFLPLLIGQGLCGYVLLKRIQDDAWRETSAVFLFFSVGASIALVSQIYHIPGGTGPFLLTWMLLCAPLIYIMRSSVTSLLYLAGITYYAVHQGYFLSGRESPDPLYYWPLLFIILPHYYYLYRRQYQGNFITFHHWMVPLSLIICLGSVGSSQEEWLYPAYASLFGILWLVGNLPIFEDRSTRVNGYKILSMPGMSVLLLILSFNDVWRDIGRMTIRWNALLLSPEFLFALLLTAGGLILWVRQYRKEMVTFWMPFSYLFLLFIPVFLAGISSPVGVILVNIFLLGTGILMIRNGAQRDHLGILNFGLLLITALVICRFFDTDLDFVVRGLLFVVVGAGFFVANYLTIKKRKTHAS